MTLLPKMHISKLDTYASLCRCGLHHPSRRVHVASQILQAVSSTATLHTTSTQQLPKIPLKSHLLGQFHVDHASSEAYTTGRHQIVFVSQSGTAASIPLCAACGV